jgi:predicted nuclease of restriction endonuclease-like RecB superfamily
LQSCAEGLVQKAEKRAGTDDIAVVRAMAELVWQRELDAMETSDIRNFLSESGLKTPEERRKALISIAQSFLISNEFHFID